MREGKVRVVCLSGLVETEGDDQDVLQCLNAVVGEFREALSYQFTPIDRPAELVIALSDKGLSDADVLILAAHGYGGDLKMRDGNLAASADIFAELKKGALPNDAILFVFACSGATSPSLLAFVPAAGRGPRMVFAATRGCPSHPMRDALRCVVRAVIERNLDPGCATRITEDNKGCEWDGKKWRGPPTKFLRVIP
jgi:hypothetical protein